MIAVVQRVSSASVEVKSQNYFANIGMGLCVLVGIEDGDSESHAEWMANKLANLRIFQDDAGKMNNSVLDLQGEILLISQFTLAGECNAGNRPSFISAAKPEQAEPLVSLVGETLVQKHGIGVSSGIFGAMMQVTIVNEGPVTLIIERR
ncbi:MAG: D-aminoacyl-tRNA deacylase [Phycisphaerales bacterium]|jgi:D-tyrosyl-tRNA(Tyr) deacylase|nr:D-aminoacyl-tRNA deacylase [Phycisphaerales bacterium]